MEDWIAALKTVQNREHFESTQYSMDHFSGMHNWYACSHARPTYCNVCREALSGVTSHGLSCEVCKFKAHKRCAVRATNNCKWTTLASIGKDIIEDEDGISMPHQWLEGNLPVSAKCTVCDKTCGSVLRLQDWRCLWCKAMVHTACKELLPSKCPLGLCKVSVIPPTALNSIDSDAPSFDDKILEVVAVFGSMQMAVSRVINLQHHRIAQCRTVKIAILGEEGVPVQVDGEAWIQPPGYIWIVHKNRAQTLTRDRAFESTLKSWEDKQKCELSRPSSFSLQPEIMSEEESTQINQFGQTAGALIHSIREIAQSYQDMEQELAHAVNASSKSMDKVYAKSKSTEGLNCSLVVEMVNNVKALHNETELLMAGKMALQLDPPQKEQLQAALADMDLQLRKLAYIPWLWQLMEPCDEENQMLDYSKRSRSGKFRLVTKFKKEKNNKNKETHSSMGLPGTKSAHVLSLSLSHQCGHNTTRSLSVSSHVFSVFCFACLSLFLEWNLSDMAE
uniref:diacylglycerol kinase (ATP) n=1 Tax=Gallus gallus TaxID=9031 RepID=A0A8V0ZL34_CHICK